MILDAFWSKTKCWPGLNFILEIILSKSFREISFISSKEKREEVRYNRKNSRDFSDTKTFKNYLKSLKADFFFEGKFNVIIDSLTAPLSKTYKLDLQILSTKDASAVWGGTRTVTKWTSLLFNSS